MALLHSPGQRTTTTYRQPVQFQPEYVFDLLLFLLINIEGHLAIIWVQSVRFDKTCGSKRSSFKTTYQPDPQTLTDWEQN